MADREDPAPLDESNSQPVFYYSRERRMERASPMVRALNEGKTVRPGLVKTLFAARGNMFVFAAVIMMISVAGLAFRFSGRAQAGIGLGGNTLSVSISREEGILFLDIMKKTPNKGEAYIGPVDIIASPVMPKTTNGEAQEIPPVYSHRMQFTQAYTEMNRISLPFEGEDFLVILITPGEQKQLKLKPVDSK